MARAVGDDRGIRVGWDNFDARALDGTQDRGQVLGVSAELAAEASLRSRLGRLTSRPWNTRLNEYANARTVHAAVYVFAVQMQTEPSGYDMLDLGHWSFSG